MAYGRNTQNESGDTVCWACRGNAYGCDCPAERGDDESAEAFRARIAQAIADLVDEYEDAISAGVDDGVWANPA